MISASTILDILSSCPRLKLELHSLSLKYTLMHCTSSPIYLFPTEGRFWRDGSLLEVVSFHCCRTVTVW